ncbi:RNA methyltransferase [bacterium]|nr:RNA methyltransferase [bacterium]
MAKRKSEEDISFRSSVYIALLNYPSLNKGGEIVSTSITPLSVHDIARASATYGVKKYFVVNPVISQRRLIKRISDYWNTGFGKKYNENRSIALSYIKSITDLKVAVNYINRAERKFPKLVTTSARRFPNTITFKKLRKKIFTEKDAYLIILGTGWGLPPEIMLESDYILEAINGFTDFNHLSVRSAASVILDRLLGKK